jgi:predicted DNA-binding protein (MmcQ/YjbR family)
LCRWHVAHGVDIMAVDQGIYMAKRSLEKPQLARLTEIALKLPETTRKTYGSHAQFLVRKKTFAYFLDNHHGDGIVAITGKVLPGDNKALAEAQPGRFYLPAYIGSRGWVALRLDVGKVDWSEVEELLKASYALLAPRKLAEQVKSHD